MTQLAAWEEPLVEAALEGLSGPAAWAAEGLPPEVVGRSFAACAAITARHSRTFHLASALLPRAKRRAIRALYAFCRCSDDLVDRPEDDAPRALAAWRAASLGPTPDLSHPVVPAWTVTGREYAVPVSLAEALINAVETDITRTRHATFAELASYCYGVASTVGLMSMCIIGYAGPEAVPHAVRMGVALQLTNILRDVREDWERGRVYLPQDELSRHGLTCEDIARGVVDDRWREFMRFQVQRNRDLYREAWPGVALLHPEGQFAVAAAAELYSAILHDIERHDYDVFSRRAHVGRWGKVRRLPGTWWKLRASGRRALRK